ncbi:MAG: hypothetical protein WCD71_19700 [Candidatus Sulfotelmatobacter sp.]
MLKQSLLILAAAGLISIAAPFAGAQDSNSQQSAPMQENGGHHHGPPDPAKRTAELTKQLNLTSDQQPKVLDALQSEHSQMESLHQDSSLSREDRHAKMMDIRKSTDDQIRGLLDPTQQKKWDEMQAKHEQWMQNRHGGAPEGHSTPPQQ